MESIQQLKESIIQMRTKQAQELTQSLLQDGMDPNEILNQGLIPGMDEVGRLFTEGEYFVPEVLVAAKAMNGAMAILEPLLSREKERGNAKIVAGTIEGDLHDIGKNLLCMMLKGAGMHIVDLGVDVSPERFSKAVQEEKPDFVAISALLTSTMMNIPRVIAELQQKGLRESVKILVGGAPLTQEYAQQIGADGYSADASEAVALVRTMMG
ncbi:MAG TPA: corrinoid protein [Thermotogota bacterium]|nr:corrinoid protein [Thermotogota bacterium]HRW92506.1 corrinoid protein [Thermotogota bacterium]